jgi:hypothetical protein
MKQTISIIFAAALTLATASAQFTATGNRGFGPKDGTGYGGNGPKDGTGYGAKAGRGNGSGTCDQTGPKGNQGSGQRGGRSGGGRR